MDARELDEATSRLTALRRQAREQLGVGGVALALAIASTQVRPDVAVPLLLGGIAVGALGLRSYWRRWDLLDRLAGQGDANVKRPPRVR
jgi:hypothetical protein